MGLTLRRIAIVFDTHQEGLQREKALNTRVQKTKKLEPNRLRDISDLACIPIVQVVFCCVDIVTEQWCFVARAGHITMRRLR